jgi:membrane protease YdiL (CAAX protease family)
MLPTFALGVIFGYTVWRTGSIFCSILIHALNNGLIVTLVHYEAFNQHLRLDEVTMVPWSITLAAAAVMVAGLALLRSAPSSRDSDRANLS